MCSAYQHTKYLGQRSSHLKVTPLTHIQRTECSIWTTSVSIKNLKAKILCGSWHHKVRRLSNMIKIGVHSVTLHDRCYSLYRRTLRLKHGWYRDRGGSLVTPAAWSLILQLTPTDADSRLQQMLRENTSNMAESFDVTHHSPRDRFPSPLLVMVCLARHKYNVNYSETATTKMFDSFNSTEKCRAHFNELLSVLTALSAVNETNLNSSSTWYPDTVRLSHNAENVLMADTFPIFRACHGVHLQFCPKPCLQTDNKIKIMTEKSK